MSGSEPAPGGVPPGGYAPAAGWYRHPAGSDALAWWDGREWADPAAWRLSEGARAPLPEQLMSWLASPAASPLLVTVAAVTAAGWVTGAAVLAGVVIAGHPVATMAASLSASAIVLPALDGLLGLCTLICGPSRPSRPARPGHAVRRAARRAAGATRRRLPMMRGAVRAVLRARSPAGLVLAAASWSTVLLFAWLTVRTLLHGGVVAGDAGASAGGQELAAAAWAVHSMAWCRVACRRLGRNRAAVRIPASAHA